MGVFFKSWGLDGSLGVDKFASLHSNGVLGNPVSTFGLGADGNDHCALVALDGFAALQMKVLQTDSVAANGHRTELLPGPTNGASVVDYVGIADWGAPYNTKERWYRVQFKLPWFDTTFLDGTGDWVIVAQLHQSPDTTPADVVANPPIAIHLTATTIQVINVASAAEVTTNANKVTRVLYEVPLEFGKWIDFTINVKWSWTTLGKIVLWHDRRRVYSESGVMNCPNNATARGSLGNYAKFGLYTHYPMSDYTNQDLQVYHRGMIVGDESTVFSDMFPELPGAVELPPLMLRNGYLPDFG